MCRESESGKRKKISRLAFRAHRSTKMLMSYQTMVGACSILGASPPVGRATHTHTMDPCWHGTRV